jgi:transposase
MIQLKKGRKDSMFAFNLKLSRHQQAELENQLAAAEGKGDLPEVKRILALLSLVAGQFVEDIAEVLKISIETIRQAVHRFLLGGAEGMKSKSRPGRPAKLTKTQRKKLSKWVEMGPEKMGFPGSCWRTPMLRHLILEKFGVFYSARYLSELLRAMGFSYQKATFVSDGRDEKARKKWLKKRWPEILDVAKKKNAHIFFGDESSFPQWGSLSYTWARIGQQPVVKTCGSRKGYKVFGLIEYFTGKFLARGHEGKLNAESYQEFLKDVMKQTRKHIILVQDNAPYHTCPDMQAFFYDYKDRITIYQLPVYSPDYNPIEKLWKKVKEKGIHMCYFPTFDDLKGKVNQMLSLFKDAKVEVLSLFGFYDKLEIA